MPITPIRINKYTSSTTTTASIAGSKAAYKPIPPCIHRSEQIGYVDCGCNGQRSAYRCAKFIRPDHSPQQQAFCVLYLPTKRLKIVEMDKRTVISEIRRDELLECSRCEGYEARTPEYVE